MSSAVPYREDLQDGTESLNTGQCKTLTLPTGKTAKCCESKWHIRPLDFTGTFARLQWIFDLAFGRWGD